MKFTVYSASTGKILRTGECSPYDLLLQARNTSECAIGKEANDATQYILNGEVTDKHEITATLSGLVISGLPIPVTVTIERVRYEVVDGTVELSFNFPGAYKVLCEALHYLPKTFEVTV